MNKSMDWPNLTDDQVRLTRDYASSARERRQARRELAERSALMVMRDEAVRVLAESGEDPGTKLRARREWRRRVTQRHVAQEQEAEHATG